MKKFCNKFHNINGTLVNSDIFDDNIKKIGKSVYDVFRVKSRCPIFINDHIARLYMSAQLINEKINLKKETILKEIDLLIEKNNNVDGNVKIIIDFTNNNYYISYINHHYPSIEEYNIGIETKLFYEYRQIAKAKTINVDFKKRVSKFIESNNISEAILVDKNNNICEGSRSNIFFIKDSILHTPKTEKILNGISRGNIIKICKDLKIEIHEVNINKIRINDYDSAFITGTSPLVLAIKTIDNHKYNTNNKILSKLRNKYIKLIEEQIVKHKKKSE